MLRGPDNAGRRDALRSVFAFALPIAYLVAISVYDRPDLVDILAAGLWMVCAHRLIRRLQW